MAQASRPQINCLKRRSIADRLRTLLAIPLLAATVTACSVSDADNVLEPMTVSSIPRPAVPEPVKLKAPGNRRFGDFKPVSFGDHSPDRYPVHGTDVSKWQGDIDWNKKREAGIAFVFIKATEGGDHTDERFDEYWRGARAVGIAHAPYHFYYFCTPARDQALWYIRNVPKAAVQMPPVLDMEWNHASKTCKLRPDPETVRAEMKIWMDIVERHYGKRPIIYTTVDFHRENLDGHFRQHQFWLRSVAAHPDVIYPDHPWTFWQYTGTGMMPGVKGNTDINVFAGSKSQWRDWLKKYGS